jgi:hypothetical protein
MLELCKERLRERTDRKLEKVAYWEASQFVQELLVTCEADKCKQINFDLFKLITSPQFNANCLLTKQSG